MQNFTFYTLVGSQVLKRDLLESGLTMFRRRLEDYFQPSPTGVGPVFRAVETKDAFYLHCWGREITALHRLDNQMPLVLYPDYDFDRDGFIIKEFLQPLGLWNDGQFGVWSFAVEENIEAPDILHDQAHVSPGKVRETKTISVQSSTQSSTQSTKEKPMGSTPPILALADRCPECGEIKLRSGTGVERHGKRACSPWRCIQCGYWWIDPPWVALWRATYLATIGE